MSCTREQLVAKAKSWLGCNEYDGSFKKIIDTYNSHKPLARGYALKYTDEWCSGFASACAIACGATDIIPTEVGCGKHIELFQKMGIWVENDAYVPSAGDYIFYYWNDNGVGDCISGASHVGIVEKVSGGYITIIEGNYSCAVKRRTIAVNSQFIRGYGVPKYAAEKADTTPDEVCRVTLPVLKKGSVGDSVKSLQILLSGYGYKMVAKGHTYGVDGSFGTATDNAVRAFQKATGLDVDGSVGPKTWAKLLGG